MRTATRPPLRRILAIDRAVRAGHAPTAGRLADELECDRRTIFRDVAFMRDSLKAPIEFSRRLNGFVYTEPGFRLPFFTLTEGELVSLFVAERVMRQYRGTPFEADLSRAFQKIAEQLREELTLDLAELDAAQSFRLTAPAPHDVDVFRRLTLAIRARRRLRITYWTASRNAVAEREIDPLHLVNVDGDWFLLAYCHLRRRVQTFSPSRIRRLAETSQTFVPPDGFSPSSFFDGSFRVIREEGAAPHLVRLRFSPFAARYVGERAWHPSQQTHSLPDGGLELTLCVTSFIEVKKWALSFGGDCEVLGPPELRRQLAEESRRMAACYADAETSPVAANGAAAPSWGNPSSGDPSLENPEHSGSVSAIDERTHHSEEASAPARRKGRRSVPAPSRARRTH